MSNVIEFPKMEGNKSCAECGSEWFKVEGIVIDLDGHVTGFTMPVICHECGVVLQ